MVVVLLLASCLASAQVSSDKVSFTLPRISKPLPFNVGETLTYEVRFSRSIFSGTIGDLKLEVSKPPGSPNTELLEFKAEAISRGLFPSLFGVKVRDRYSSLVDPSDFGVLTTTKLLEEGKSRREQKSIVDRTAGRVSYTDRDLANAKSQPKVKEKSTPSWVQDVLSVIYFVRTQPLKEGDAVPVPISDAAEVYNIEVVVAGREEVKTRAGKFKAIQLNAKIFDGRYVRRNGEMLVWVTDDERRIPVRARIKFSGTTITVDLKRL